MVSNVFRAHELGGVIPVVHVTQVLAAGLFFVFSLKICICYKAVREEIVNADKCVAVGPYPIMIQFLSNALGVAVPALAATDLDTLTVYVGIALQMMLMIYFLWRSYVQSFVPVPAWFPITVSVAASCFLNNHGISKVVEMVFYWGGIAVTGIVLPVCIYRCLRDDLVAPGPGVVILCAPGSFMFLSIFKIKEDAASWAELISLFSLSQSVFLLTIYCVWRRRDKIFYAPFNPGCAAFTFPVESTTSVASVFYEYVKKRERVADVGWMLALKVWCFVLFSVSTINLTVVLYGYVRHMNRWTKEFDQRVKTHLIGFNMSVIAEDYISATRLSGKHSSIRKSIIESLGPTSQRLGTWDPFASNIYNSPNLAPLSQSVSNMGVGGVPPMGNFDLGEE